jgi:hypothetical protein
MSQNTPIAYISVEDVVKQLNLQQSQTDPNKYIIWEIPTSVDIINTFVKQANEQATTEFGNRTNSPSYGLTKQWATWRAVLNLIETMTINWVISGLPVQVGNIGFDRLAAMQGASAEVKARAQEELARIYILLSEIGAVQNYQPSSPYIATGGQWPAS